MSLNLEQIFTMTQEWADKILEAKAQSYWHCDLTNPIFGHTILYKYRTGWNDEVIIYDIQNLRG